MADRDEIYIQHAGNGGEKRVGQYLLDGYHEETHTAYEIQGCFWHGKFVFDLLKSGRFVISKDLLFLTGCTNCYTCDTMNPVKGQTMHDLYQSTVEKILYLKNQGYNVIEVWECGINRELADDEEMKQYFDQYSEVDSLE